MSIKETILERLYALAGQCAFCHKAGCGHKANTELPATLNTDDVLKAINLDEWYVKEPRPNGLWLCERCGELVKGHEVKFDETHAGCGGRCE